MFEIEANILELKSEVFLSFFLVFFFCICGGTILVMILMDCYILRADKDARFQIVYRPIAAGLVRRCHSHSTLLQHCTPVSPVAPI